MQLKGKCPFCLSDKLKYIVNFENITILGCKSCTNAWTHPPPAKIPYSQMDFHLDNLQCNNTQIMKNDLTELPLDWKNAIVQQVKLIQKYVSSGSTILDIGCGEGILLDQIKKAGFKAQGIEPSESASRRAKEKGLNVVTDCFPSPLVTGIVDAVIMVQVLEHTADPLDTLIKIADIVPNGYLFLVQTNYKGLVPVLRRNKWYAWVPDQHFWHFSPKGLEYICKEAGFEKVDLEYSTLVHKSPCIRQLTRMIPLLGDQFHLVLKRSQK